MQEQKNGKGLIIGIIIVVALIIIGGGALLFSGKSSSSVAVTTPVPVTPPPASADTTSTEPATTPSASPYKDGTYTATGSYGSPAGTESIGVSLTLKDGVVTDATVTNEARNRESSQYENRFISGFKQYVIGKNINTLSLSRVSGASLTSNGFNAAVATIKAEAKV